MDPQEAAVEFEDVAARYGSGPEVLSGLDMRIGAGSFHFLTGPSGAGKSTLIRLMLVALRPSRGRVSLFGHDVAGVRGDALARLRRRIGIVFQDFRLLDHLTAYENVALPLRVQGYEEASYRGEVQELIGWVGLAASASSLPPTLSGGEKQRVAIARALIARPDLILADEPTGNVDPDLARRLLHLFLELNRFGTSVILATHDPTLLQEVDAPRLVLDGGRIVPS